MLLLNDEVNSSTEDEGSMDTKEAENNGSNRNSHKNDDEQKHQRSNNTDSNLNTADNPDLLLNMLIEVSKKLGYQIKGIFHYIMQDLGGYQIFDRFAQWCVQHPQLAICLLAAGIVAAMPVLLFLAFALSTMFMTFTGFLVLEGTLLTILTMIMFGLLGAVSTVLLFFALVGVATYMGVSRVYDMYGSTETQRTNLRNVMQRSDLPGTRKNSHQNSQDENVNK